MAPGRSDRPGSIARCLVAGLSVIDHLGDDAQASSAAPASSAPASASASASASAAAKPAGTPKTGGTLRVGLLGDPASLDGHLFAAGRFDTTWQIYDRLTEYDTKLVLETESRTMHVSGTLPAAERA